jgi:hypothetical protein
MINKYNNFLLNESMLILEAFLSAHSDFLSKLDKISKQSNTSATIADMLLSRITDKDWISEIDLKQNYFKAGTESDKVSFIQQNRVKDGVDAYTMAGRSDLKVGRAIKYIAKDLYDISINDKQIEDFVNVYKSIGVEGEPNFQFYIGDDIKNGYNSNNYFSRGYGSLGGSCMNDKFSYLKIYRRNEKKVRLLVLLDDNSSICGRALVWKLDKSPCDAEYFMDRVYTNRDFEVNKFIEYAENNNFLYKQRMSCGDSEAVKFRYKGKELIGEIRVKLDGEHNKYPYMDTLFCLNKDKDEVSNIPSWKFYRLWDTDGDRDRCDDCNGKSKNKDLCYGCSEGAMLLKSEGIEVNVERGRERDK